MSNELVIVTDSCSDLNKELIEELGIVVIPMHFSFGNENFSNDPLKPELSNKEFYDRLRCKEVAVTSQVTIEDCLKYVKPLLKDKKDVLCLAFSSALSGSYNSMKLVSEILKEENKDYHIEVVDSLCASLGEGLFTYLVAKKVKEEKLDLKKAYEFAESLKGNINHYFTVDDLSTLKRGGRLSATKAFLGTLLNLKPILHVDDKGRLVPIGKKLGRKSSILNLLDYFKQRCTNHDVVFISHGDCLDEALLLKSKIEALYTDIKVFVVSEIGPVIGAHSGPGTLALFFVGEGR